MTAFAPASSPVTHDRALDLAAAAPPFRPTDEEATELAAHLATCPDCGRRVARMRTDLTAIGRVDPPVSAQLHDRIREAAVTRPRTGPGLAGIVLAFVLVAVALIGASIGVGALLGTRVPVAPEAVLTLPEDPLDTLRWHTDTVDLAAHTFWIDANGLRFIGVAKPMLHSDPGDATRWTLEASWTEQGREQRLDLYFGGNETAWWLAEIRAYDGSDAGPKWAIAEFQSQAIKPATTPLGAVYSGDLDFHDIPSATGPVAIHLGGVRIASHRPDLVNDLPGSRRLAGDSANPFNAGGPLHCSGILQLPPQAAEARLLALGYALSWRLERKTGDMTGFSQPIARAPAQGSISDTAVGTSGELIVFVQDPAAPFGDPATLPEDCASGS
jgi:hypothetical protein